MSVPPANPSPRPRGRLLSLVAFAALGGCAHLGEQNFTLEQPKDDQQVFRQEERRASQGDRAYFEGLLLRDGHPAGFLIGSKEVFRHRSDRHWGVPGGEVEPASDGPYVSRWGQLQFLLEGENSILVEGLSIHSDRDVEIAKRSSNVRAITGGTGAYRFARGQVVSIRNVDGSYTHIFEVRR